MTASPIIYEWDGEAFAPLPRFARQCDHDYVIGQRYHMQAVEERSAKQHRMYFATLRDMWLSLPEDLADRHPSVEHLRKASLCATGHCNEMQIACASNAEALRTIATIRALDDYAVCVVRGSVVLVRTAHSQSTAAMGAERFKASMDAVLHHVSGLLGVDAADLERHRSAA